MVAPDPRATAAEVSDELDGEIDPSEILDRWLNRAHRIVEKRIPAGVEDWVKEELEILVAAHIAEPHATGAATGGEVQKISSDTASVTYNVADAPGNRGSIYWQQAVELDERIATESSDFVVETL